MAYADQAQKPGRIPVVFVEVDVDRCSRIYGSSPCTAALGSTGDRKCYNTYATCQDTANFAQGTPKTFRFCEENAAVPVGIDAIPLLRDQGVSYAPQRITPGKGLGIRASVTVRLKDAPWPDDALDPYFSSRTHDTAAGTFWGKFRARERFYEGRPLRIRSGYVVPGQAFTWDNFQTRAYIMDAIKGPGRDDTVELVAKDILKLADDKRALCPRPSKGQLSADLAAAATTCTLVPAGIGAAEYPASGRVVIGGEGMDFTRSGDNLTLTRDVYGTGARDHKADDTVQLVKRYQAEEIQDVIYDLLVNFAGIDAAYIDKPTWDLERDAYLLGVWSAELCEPTGVNTLIGELTEQGTCSVWWDEVAQEIRFRALRPPTIGLPERTDEDHFLGGSVSASEDTQSRVSQVLVYFGQIDPTAKLDETNNYRIRYFTPDPEGSGGANQHGSEAVKKVFSRWFLSTSLGRVQTLAETLLNTYRHPPRVLEFDLDAADALATGDLFYARTRYIQDDTGAPARINMMIIEAQEKRVGTTYTFKAQENIYTAPEDDTVYLADGYDIDLYQVYVNEYGVPTAAVTIEFIVPAGVVIGSTSSSSPALSNPASWPAGSVISLSNQGVIAGKGGAGGIGARTYEGSVLVPAGNGEAGGTALKAQFAITINNTGTIQGGGGGGGGAGATNRNVIGVQRAAGGGGGGGAGSQAGAAGNGHDLVSGGINASPVSGTFQSAAGTAGSLTAAGAGGNGSANGADYGGAGGAGGAPGAAGSAGASSPLTTGGAGGAAGKAVEGNSFITWTATGTRTGAIT